MARGFVFLSIVALGCGPAAKPPPAVPPAPSVVHARLGATPGSTPSLAELFSLWSKTAARAKGESRVTTLMRGDALELTVTASSSEGALFACREILGTIASDEEKSRESALAHVRSERARITSRLSEVTRSLHTFEIATNDEASARTDLARKVAAAKIASTDFPGALGLLAERLRRAENERASLAAAYGPKHPQFEANELEIAFFVKARDAQKKIEVDAAEAELAGFDALPKKKRTAEGISEMRRKLLVERLSAQGVTAERGVDVEAPLRLRELALAHLQTRLEIAKESVTIGDAHPRMMALKARLADIELAFKTALPSEIARVQNNVPVDDRTLRRELEGLVSTLSDLITEEDAIVKQVPRLVVITPCAG
jgi:uncharacterized protein involved in exopolysaccharide biosynthesis